MRSDVEQQLNLIASGKAAHGEVLQYFLKMFAKKFAYFTKQVNDAVFYINPCTEI
jgi:DNA topoisomerase-3